ncbi:MAG: hypothetical protein QOG29_700 [Gaiellaceae bacterium]|nr:hypothetical protein [Gaiellaceae bacterium]
MTQTAPTVSERPARARVRTAPPRALELALRERWFELGVALCTLGAGAFAAIQRSAWPPHEDETLALFVGRGSLHDVLHTVLGERGGAPLHFVLAWAVAHLGGGLGSLRLVSALFAALSVPVIALLVARLADRTTGLVAAFLASWSWVFLFDGVYGRMYSLFLFTSALSYLALVVALEQGGRARWTLWALAILACVATHPYGALVLASQGLYVLLDRRRLREALLAGAAVVLVGIPFWRTDLVLAGRFDVGVGGGGNKLGAPLPVLRYLRMAFGDLSVGYTTGFLAVCALAVGGLVLLWRARPSSALLVVAVFVTPTVAFMGATLGSSTSPESRHLVFTLPFLSGLVACALVWLARRPSSLAPLLAAAAVFALVGGEIAWARHKTPLLFNGEPAAELTARDAAADWLARTGRTDDVLFGYEPLYLGAWERRRGLRQEVVPRADPRLALDVLRRAHRPLGRGVWVFDASDTNNFTPRQSIDLVYPQPAAGFEAQAWGPYLVIRTLGPTRTVKGYLEAAALAQGVGKRLYIGDADINLVTVQRALEREAQTRSRSTTSR